MCISDLNMFEDNQATLIRKISGTKITVTRDRENVTGIDGVIFTVQIIRRLRNISERKIVSQYKLYMRIWKPPKTQTYENRN